MYDIIGYRKTWYAFSAALFAVAVILLLTIGLPLGVDFRGGSSLEITLSGERPSQETLTKLLEDTLKEKVAVQAVGDKGFLIRLPETKEQQHQELLTLLRDKIDKNLQEEHFQTVGPIIGSQLRTKALQAIVLSLALISLYIAWMFRPRTRVSTVSSWVFGLGALIALFHDLIIPIGFYTLFVRYGGAEVNTDLIAALLTILGYSMSDTVVVYDRVRENLTRGGGSFEEIVNRSVNETIKRSVYTSVATLLAILAVALFGGVTIRYFSWILIVGIASGTYSSIFIASAFLVSWWKHQNRATAR